MRDKILVADDDPSARMMLAHLFEAAVEVLTASTGPEALRIIETQRPQLLLLDMIMPGMNGLEVLKAARAAAPAMGIIMLTGANDVALAKQALELGAAEYVTKPFDLSQLKEKALRMMGTHAVADKSAGGLPWRIQTPGKPAAEVAGNSLTNEEYHE